MDSRGKQLRILHIVPSLDPADGGPTVAAQLLARATAQRGARVTVATTQRGKSKEHPPAPRLRPDKEDDEGVEYIYTKRNTEFYKVSFELVRWLKANIQNFDVVHIH